jgi:2-iminobutanoate/2-iminopropanoate deaminase
MVIETTTEYAAPMAMPEQIVRSARIPALGPYSQAVRVNDLLFTAGQAGIDPATGIAPPTLEAQIRQAMTNLRALLEDAGSGLDRVVKVTCFLADAAGFATLNQVFAEFFPSAPPARSVPIVALPRGLLFSIEAIADAGRRSGS